MKHLSNTNVNTTKVENVPTPVNSGDAVNKAYADTKVNKNTLYYDVKDFGAIGDGTINDTSNIQSALDAAQAAGGGIVFFPAGTYRVSHVFAGSGVSIQGAGSECTVVKRIDMATDNPSNSVGAINFHGTSAAPLNRFFVRDITADGNRLGITAGTGDLVDNEAFSFIHARNFTVDSCQGINSPGEGFDLDYCVNGTIVNSIGNDNGGNGFHVSLSSSRMKLIGNYAYGNGFVLSRAGFDQWNDADSSVFVGNISEANYCNYKIQGTEAVVSANRSRGSTTVDDIFTGAAPTKAITGYRGGTVSAIKGDVIELSGWTWFVGTGTGSRQTASITFPIAVDEVLSAQATYLGGKNSANPTHIGDFVDAVSTSYGAIGLTSISTTGMNVDCARTTGSWAANWRYGFSWRISAVKKR